MRNSIFFGWNESEGILCFLHEIVAQPKSQMLPSRPANQEALVYKQKWKMIGRIDVKLSLNDNRSNISKFVAPREWLQCVGFYSRVPFSVEGTWHPFCRRSTESSPETLLLCENGLMHCTPELRERETYRWARSHSLFEGVIHLNVLWVSGIGTRSENWEATARKKRDRGRKSALVLKWAGWQRHSQGVLGWRACLDDERTTKIALQWDGARFTSNKEKT